MVVKLLAILLLVTGRILSNLLRPTKTALEASLIGAEGSSRPWFLPRPWVARFSPRSAPRPPHHGVRRVGVPICVATSGAVAPRLEALSGIASPVVPTGTTRLRPAGRKLDLPQAAVAASSSPQR